MSSVKISGLVKSFGGDTVLDGVDLVVEDHSLTAILGPSGSGKTTLLRVLAGFEDADAGRIELGGDLVVDGTLAVPPERRHIGYVPQEGALFPHLTVARNVAFGLPRGPDRAACAQESLELVGMARYAKRLPHELSGGQQQRVALARALAPRPRLLLLDEPFSSLDAQMRVELRTEVAALLRATGTTSVLVTHDQDEALSTADYVAILVRGRIRQAAAPRVLYDEPVARRIARFVGVANFVLGTLEPGGVRTPFGLLPLRAGAGTELGRHVVAMIRPERLELVPTESSAPDCIEARVASVEYHGHDALVYAAPLTDGLLAQRPRVASHPAGRLRPAPPVTEIVVRTDGEEPVSVGELVRIRAQGPVVIWPEPQLGAAR